MADYVAWKAGEPAIVIDVKTTCKVTKLTRMDEPYWFRKFIPPTTAQRAAGVKILYVDRDTRQVSFNRQDFDQPLSQRLGRRPASILQTEAALPPRGPSLAGEARPDAP
jgi:hypothetical protein